MIMHPQMMFIILSTLLLNLLLKIESSVVIPRNQQNDAVATPLMNLSPSAAGSVALKAPSIMVPSMMAWGLNQVTTQAVEMTFNIGTLTSFEDSRVSSFERSSEIPIHMTIRLPMSSTAISISCDFSMIAPMPKKHARASVTSKKITMKAVANDRLLVCVRAVLITKKFCSPIGAT